MTDFAHAFAPIPAVSPITELRRRQPALAAVGLAFLILAAVSASLSTIDGRLIDGVSVWAKPAKFYLSSGVFMLTSAWFFGYVRPERRNAARLKLSVRALIAFAVFELGYITFQAAQGQPSHFYRSDPIHFALYGMMGAAALGMLATKIPLAIEIARRPAQDLSPELRRAVVLGLWLTVTLGALSGLYVSQQYGSGHNVGAVGGHAPLFGWNRLGGDLRVAHFFGMHAEQVMPAVAAIALAMFGPRATRTIVTVSALAIVLLTAGVFAQAVMGRPFPM